MVDNVNKFTSLPTSIISFLRMEADLSEERANRLRKEAAAIAEKFGITDEQHYADLPPLDGDGKPKYKGKKRGRKKRERKRKNMKPDRPKRKHTGYTLFMHKTYPNVKTEQPNLVNKELISLVAKQWKELDDEEKKSWKERAQINAKQIEDSSSNPTLEGTHHDVENDEENSSDDEIDDDNDNINNINATTIEI